MIVGLETLSDRGNTAQFLQAPWCRLGRQWCGSAPCSSVLRAAILGTMKARLPATRLQAMVQVRLNAQPEVQKRIAADARTAPVVGQPTGHERDARGRNWDITTLERDEGLERTFRAIVDGLRESFDLG